MSYARKKFDNRRNRKMANQMNGWGHAWGGYCYNSYKERYIRYHSKVGYKKYVKKLFSKRLRLLEKEEIRKVTEKEKDFNLTNQYKKVNDFWSWD